MIKRRFFKLDHGDRDASDPSSSSSDSELEAEAESAEEESEDDATAEVKPNDDEPGSTSSGYASEDSSANDVDVDSTGMLFSEDDAGAINEKPMLFNKELLSKCDTEKSNVITEQKSLLEDVPSYVLKHKSVFKCKICPRITCLSENTLRDHLQSKRHARSEKLLSEGRLKAVLNSDGEIENQEVAEIQTKDTDDNAEKNRKGQKQHKKRLRKKKSDRPRTRKMPSTKGTAKRSRNK
ncbi:unnamed protein product [Sphenostylis stenocarpa]|uniref:C2H2-type domain-containing protein n=1 Tax=Sphenostylis stenocarpa TaxID=92480 RepID=A0AA86V1X8_9FABA|nr:unnamed protein product [Sphenostylis stenocarpa]